MSRDASGNYSLPAGNPVTTGTTIEASWANTTMPDIATALTNSLDRTGKGSMTASLKIVDGTISAPGVAFANATSTGLYRASAGDIRMAITGTDVLKMALGAATWISNSAAATAGPAMTLWRDSASPAASDLLGQILFDGEDDGGNQTTYASIDVTLVDPTDTSEDGKIVFKTQQAGTLTTVLTLDESGNATFAGNITATGTITGAGGGLTFTDLTLEDTDAGAGAGPDLKLWRNSASPAANDLLGQILFNGEDDGGNETQYARIYAEISDPTDAAEDGAILFQTMQNGTLTTAFYLDSNGFAVANGAVYWSGTALSAGTYLGASGANPIINFAANDYLLYDATANSFDFVIGGTEYMSLAADAVSFNAGIKESVGTMPSGTAPAIDPANGVRQTWTLTGNSTPTDSLADREYVVLEIDDGTAYTITWPTMEWIGGSAPTLDTTNTTVVTLWKSGSTLYGALVGVAS